MSETLLHAPEPGSATRAPLTNASRRGPVILALSAAPQSSSPTLMAGAIAARLQRPLRVVSAVEPTLIYGGAFSPVPMVSPIEHELRDAREVSARRHMSETLHDMPYDLDLRYGYPVFEIANAALEVDASLVVIGAAPHETRRGIVAGGRANSVLRNVRCPVLSVAPSGPGLPMQAVVAVDFSPASLRAARDALMVVGDGGTITLLHVAPSIETEQPVHLATGAVYSRDGLERLRVLRDHLVELAPAGVTIVTRVASGDPVEEIFASIEALNADLVVVGTHGPGMLERTFVGSVAADVLRTAPCSVLVAPPPSPATRLEYEADEWGTGASTERTSWSEALDAFTRRNTGRRVRVEIDDLEYGAQVQATGFSLQGTTYDAHDQRVDVMLANGAGSGHLTRGIPGVDRIAIARGHDGRDRALQLRHGGGETLLIFTGG